MPPLERRDPLTDILTQGQDETTVWRTSCVIEVAVKSHPSQPLEMVLAAIIDRCDRCSQPAALPLLHFVEDRLLCGHCQKHH